MKDVVLEYFVINYSWNKQKCEPFNVFNNVLVYESTIKAVKKYLRAPSKFLYRDCDGNEIYGFEAFVEELDHIIGWQEHWRCEYEFSAGPLFFDEGDMEQFTRFDCYEQCHWNKEIIANYVISQYKKYLKAQSSSKDPV